MLICELESLNKSNSFINISANCVVIDLNRPNLMLFIKDKHASQSSSVHWISLFLYEDSIVLAHLFADISNEWIVNLAESSILSLGLEPCEMGEVRVS